MVQALADAKIIDSQRVTFAINFDGTASEVTFGDEPDGIRNGIVTLDLYSKYDQWWTVKLRGNHYGGKNIQVANTNYAILDTGTSLIALS